MLGQLLLEWFPIDASVLQNTDNSSRFLNFDLSFSKSPQPNPMLSSRSRGDAGLSQGLDEVACVRKTPLLLEEKRGRPQEWVSRTVGEKITGKTAKNRTTARKINRSNVTC